MGYEGRKQGCKLSLGFVLKTRRRGIESRRTRRTRYRLNVLQRGIRLSKSDFLKRGEISKRRRPHVGASSRGHVFLLGLPGQLGLGVGVPGRVSGHPDHDDPRRVHDGHVAQKNVDGHGRTRTNTDEHGRTRATCNTHHASRAHAQGGADQAHRMLQRAAPSASAAETRVLEAMSGSRWYFLNPCSGTATIN